ncbi:MAG: amidohydrolase [Myxococcales bacterium]|nr:amidohydrolase [Myxococcales bacterium]
MNRVVTSDIALVDGEPIPRFAVRIEGGAIAACGPREQVARRGDALIDLGRRAMLPGTVNAHNHSFQSLLRGFGDDLPFLEWRERALYRFTPAILRPGADGVYCGALFAFAEMALHGVTTVCDFFYLHDGGNHNARRVIQAALDVGLRVVMARCFYDWEGAPASYRETPAEAARRFRELHGAFAGHPMVTVQPAPHSLHGASEAMIRAGVECAREAGTRWHIHLAEERYQVEESLTRFGATPLRVIEKLDLLGDDLIAVHGCWFDEGERALLAERGASLAYNPGSNMFLGDGITDVVDLDRRRVRIALGTDGGCSNSRVSVLDEMRSCALLQKVANLDGKALSAERALHFGTRGGGEVLGLPIGRLAPGERADLCFLDLDDPSLWPEQSLAKNVVYSLSARAVTDVFVEGAEVVRDRRLVRVDQLELRDRVRALTDGWMR